MPRRIADPYEVLGLDRSATPADVRRAYLRLAKRHHPDKNPGDKTSDWIFKEIQSAYEILRNAKEVRAGQQQEPPSQGERAKRDRRDAAGHDRSEPRQSERAKRKNHNGWRQSRSQAGREHRERERTKHTTSEGSGTQATHLHRAIRWSKWAVYCSNAFLWPATLAGWMDGWLEGLPERAEWLVFFWIMLGPGVLCWDFVLKEEVEKLRRWARQRR